MILPPIYLASTSPRRSELLRQIKVDFQVLRVSVDESVQAEESAESYVKRVASMKAEAGWQASLKDRPVLAADTSVVIDGHILGKPETDNEARRMLSMLSGRCHQVMTAVAVQNALSCHCLLQVNEVTFSALSEADIDWYIASGEGRDKAGGYAVQGLAAVFIHHINGSYSGIMGLPLFETVQLLRQVNSGEQ
ncbi:Maf family protein [Methylophaga lonarensis]|uniref:Maf family protein n=1 Tax=Methylophaga lonarensis TaxID=999151 RepID=UPI003D2689C0